MENFSLVSSHNLLENPLLFPTEITNLLFVIKTRQPLKQNFMLNCKKTMISDILPPTCRGGGFPISASLVLVR